MQSNDWAPEHSQALRDLAARGMSFSEIAKEINAKFGTSYTRSAAIGRGRRMGLAAPSRPERRDNRASKLKASDTKLWKTPVEPETSAPPLPPPRTEPLKLRCVGVSPRLIPLIELKAADCRYPYGGDKDGEPIAFCGHPRQDGSSYCAPHFHLTRGPGTTAERAVAPVLLRLVRAA
jgi:GcrA cell cycle regulator